MSKEDDSIHGVVRFLRKDNVRLKHENDQLRQELSGLRDVLDALSGLHEVSTSISIRTDVLFLMTRILESALTSIRAQDGSLMLLDSETNELVFIVAIGEIADTLLGYRIPADSGIAGWVATHQEPVIVQDVNRDFRFSLQVDETFDFRTKSLICVPITRDGNLLGVIQALNKGHGEPFVESDLTVLELVARLAGSAMNRMEQIIETDDPVSTANPAATPSG